MSDTLNRRYEAAADSITEFYFTESREHDVALARPVVDAADAAVDIQAAVKYVKDQPIFDGWSDLQIATLLDGAVDAALGRQSNE